MTHPSQPPQWQFPYATQIPDDGSAVSFPYTPSPYPSYVPVRPPSPSQVNPYSPELQASPGWSDGEYSEEYTTPELESAGPSSVESNYSSLFSALTPHSESSASTVPTGLGALESPADPRIRPDHTVNTMIRAALRDSPLGKLPSRDIVKAIQARFPYYLDKGHEKNLKNTIRHHLSNTKGFVKLGKDPEMKGKGDYWTYDPEAAQAAKARIDVPGSTSTAGASRRRSPPAGASSPYPRPRRAIHRGSEDTITQRSAATRSSQRIGPIRVSPKVRPSTRLALPDDRIPMNPRPIRPAARGLTSTRQGGSQQNPSHGLWSPRGPVNSVPSSPEPSETVLDAPGGLKQRAVVDRDGFVYTSFFQPSSTVVSPPFNTSSPLQLPLPQISSSLAENRLLQLAASNQINTFPASPLTGLDQASLNPAFDYDDQLLSRLYLNLDEQAEFPFLDQSSM